MNYYIILCMIVSDIYCAKLFKFYVKSKIQMGIWIVCSDTLWGLNLNRLFASDPPG